MFVFIQLKRLSGLFSMHMRNFFDYGSSFFKEELARRRVLEQIKMDREAQKAVGMATNTASQLVKQDVVTAPPAASSCTSSRLQVRLPDGSLIREAFDVRFVLYFIRCCFQLFNFFETKRLSPVFDCS